MIELAIVVPTYNERENVSPLLDCLRAALGSLEYEVIFVDDDSTDGTAARVREISLRHPRVRVIQRIGRRGLASACIEGMMATAAPYIAVMDADLQHDETVLPQMLAKLKAESLDLVVATRNSAGGSMGDFSKSRVQLSDLGKRLADLVSRCPLSDPMSGFFVLDRHFLEEVVRSASGVGFKILLDLVASSSRPVRVGEVPYRFRQRVHGSSKLDILVGVEYLQLLLDKFVGDFLPPRFVIFGAVGAFGATIHLAILYILLTAGRSFSFAQTTGTVIVMTVNFFLNNAVTYRDRRLRGARLLIGLISFYAVCSIGALVTIRVATFATASGTPWYLAGSAGIIVSSVWNYGVTAVFTWREVRRKVSLRREAHVPVDATNLLQ